MSLCNNRKQCDNMNMDRKNMLRIFLLAACIIVFYLALNHLNLIFAFLNWLMSVLTPFIIAGCMIFFLNVPLKAIERHLFRHKNGKPATKLEDKARRPVAIILSFMIFIIIIAVFLLIIIPEIAKSLSSLSESIPGTLENLQKWVTAISEDNEYLGQFIEGLSIDWKSITNTLVGFLTNNSTSLVTSVFTLISSIVSVLISVFLGCVLSIYVLMNKEKISSDVKKLLYSILPEKVSDFIVNVGHLTNRSFYNSITGQMIECLIVGSLTALGMTIFGFSYAALGGVVIAVLSWVPMFGIYIGSAIVAFILLTVDPFQALWFFIFMICLQQIEGNFIYPKVVGAKVGLPPLIFVSAIIIFSNVFGVIGLLVSGPVTFVIYTLIRQFIYKRIDQRDIPPEKYEVQYESMSDNDELQLLQKELDKTAKKVMSKAAHNHPESGSAPASAGTAPEKSDDADSDSSGGSLNFKNFVSKTKAGKKNRKK